MKSVYPIVFVLCVFLTVGSCKKEQDESVLSAEDNSAIETEFAQVYEVSADFLATDAKTGKQENLILPDGATIAFEDSIFTDLDGIACVIDYGTLDHGSSYKGIPCRDGRYRAGKIHVGMSNRFSETGCNLLLTITSADEYYVGDGTKMYKLAGLQTIVRTSDSTFTQTVQNGYLQRENGTAYWTCERTISLLHPTGNSWWNKEYAVSGTVSGTNKNGVTFTSETITPLHKKLELGCLNTFISGKEKLKNTNGSELAIDYGNGTCENTLAVTVNGINKSITVW